MYATMENCLVLFFLLLFYAKRIDCLHCFTCSNVTQHNDCDIVTQCSMDENCPDEHQFTMVGRRSANKHCLKCCSRDGCNKRYCEPPDTTVPKPTVGSCVDDPTQNCSKLASAVYICSTPQLAKTVCRKYCGLCDMVDGSWSGWNDWSSCSTTCGLGIETRTRQCNDPAPAHGGYNCAGNDKEQRSCFPRPCPVHGGWSTWAPWEGCSESCGTGLQTRHRTCTNPSPSYYGQYCLGDPVEYSLCHGNSCGNQSTDSTIRPTATVCDNVLVDCDTVNKTLGVCNNFDAARKTCAQFCGLCGIVDGAWSGWSSWLPCSTSCGQGTSSRTRTCNHPAPHAGGKSCTGNNTESKHCTPRACPVHGGWGHWAQWSSCSSSCDQGITRRTRGCDNPRPQLLGNYCFGDSTEYGMCLIKKCPVDGGWTDWSFWSSCSATCGNGQAIRQRSCVNPTPTNGGLHCPGPKTQQKACNITRCSGAMSAFTVANPTRGLSSGDIRFPHVITNLGGHYNTSTGIFTCQYPGIYVFTLHIIKAMGYDNAQCSIRKNGQMVVEAWTNPERDHDGGAYGSTNSAVLHLVHGDTVDVGGCTSRDSMYTGGDWGTSFTGFLLKAD